MSEDCQDPLAVSHWCSKVPSRNCCNNLVLQRELEELSLRALREPQSDHLGQAV